MCTATHCTSSSDLPSDQVEGDENSLTLREFTDFVGARGSLARVGRDGVFVLLDQILPGRNDAATRLAVVYLDGPLATGFSEWPHLNASNLRLVASDAAEAAECELLMLNPSFEDFKNDFMAVPCKVSILYEVATTEPPDSSQHSQQSAQDAVNEKTNELQELEQARDGARQDATETVEEVRLHDLC